MHVKVNYGANAGRIVELPFHVGSAIVAAGRGVEVDPHTDALAMQTAEPTRAHRDPVPPPRGRGRRS